MLKRQPWAQRQQAQAAQAAAKKQKRAARVFPEQTQADLDQPDIAGPPSKRTRAAQQRAGQVYHILEEAETVREAITVFNATMAQMGTAVHCDTEEELQHEINQITKTCATAKVSHSLVPLVEVNKATKCYVEVMTDLGPAKLSVPATTKEVLTDPHAEEWLQADRRGCEVLTMAGNPMVREQDVTAAGHELVRSVVQRKLKVQHDTKRLARVDPRKSRVNADGKQVKEMRAKKGLPARERVGRQSEIADDLLLKMQWAEAAVNNEDILLADLPTAYTLGQRRRPPIYLRTPDTCVYTDAEGYRLCWELRTPVYGEAPSGDELEQTVIDDLEEAGFEEAEGVPALMTIALHDGTRAKLTRIVDDFCLTYPKGHAVGEKFVRLLKKNYGEGVKEQWLTAEKATGSHGGFAIARDRERRALTIRMSTQVESAVRRFAPRIADEGWRPSKELARGENLQTLTVGMTKPEVQPRKLTKEQEWVQGVTGALKYAEKVQPRLTLPLWHLARVMSNPPPEANTVGLLLLEMAWVHKHDGITYTATSDEEQQPATAQQRATQVHLSHKISLHEQAPTELQATADANWATPERDVYAVVMTRCGAAIAHSLRRVPVKTSSTCEVEGIASVKAAEWVITARNIERAFGVLKPRATLLGTDSSSNMQIAERQAPNARAKHALRRWHWLRQQIDQGRLSMVKVTDANMPADFLTKWLTKKKLELSLERATGHSRAVPMPELSNKVHAQAEQA